MTSEEQRLAGGEPLDPQRLGYLDLATPENPVYQTCSGGLTFYCFQPRNHKHEYHTEHRQLNLIADSLNLSHHNQSETYDFLRAHARVNLRKLRGIDEKLLEIQQQQDEFREYIKARLDSLDLSVDFLREERSFEHLKRLPTKKDIQNLLVTIDQEPKRVEKETVELAQRLTVQLEEVKSLVQQFRKELGYD